MKKGAARHPYALASKLGWSPLHGPVRHRHSPCAASICSWQTCGRSCRRYPGLTSASIILSFAEYACNRFGIRLSPQDDPASHQNLQSGIHTIEHEQQPLIAVWADLDNTSLF